MNKLTPKLLLERIIASETSIEYTYIITGRHGPTGKSWLCRELRSRGYKAFDITSDLLRCCNVEFNTPYNSYTINELDNHMVIILNEPLEKEN